MPKMPLPPAEAIQLDSLAEFARGGMGSVGLARAVDGRLAGQSPPVKRLHANISADPPFVCLLLAASSTTASRSGQLKGKPAYMAPEQQRGGAVDARADLFAFGVVMFEMLAGRRPWTSKGAFDVMMEISNDPHPDLGELRKGLNPEFVAMAHK